MHPKVMGVLGGGILGLPFGNLGIKSHLNVAPVESCKVYYNRKGGAFLQVRALPPLQSVISQGACLDSLFFRYFQFGFTFESLKELVAR
jgi:hypothetical protein